MERRRWLIRADSHTTSLATSGLSAACAPCGSCRRSASTYAGCRGWPSIRQPAEMANGGPARGRSCRCSTCSTFALRGQLEDAGSGRRLSLSTRTTSLVLRSAREQRHNCNVWDDIHGATTTRATFPRSIWKALGPHRRKANRVILQAALFDGWSATPLGAIHPMLIAVLPSHARWLTKSLNALVAPRGRGLFSRHEIILLVMTATVVTAGEEPGAEEHRKGQYDQYDNGDKACPDPPVCGLF